MTTTLLVADSGRRGARANLALTAALAELHRNGNLPDMLRFQHFPPSAIIGRHQSLSCEVRLAHCRAHGIETARRMTGGGAIYMGPGLLGWELIAGRAHLGGDLGETTRTLCEGLARGLSGLGLDARFRPRNDIEVEGRKVSGTGGYRDGGTLVFQGTVLIDFDIADMAAALVLPVAKLDRKGLDALAARVVSLRELLGRVPAMRDVQDAVTAGLAGALGLAPLRGEIDGRAETLAALMLADEFGRDAFVAGDDDWRGGEAPSSARTCMAELQLGGGRIAAHLRLRGGAKPRIERVWLLGDVLVTPPRALLDLEAALVGVPLGEAEACARHFLETRGVDILGCDAGQFAAVIGAAAVEAPSSSRVQDPVASEET